MYIHASLQMTGQQLGCFLWTDSNGSSGVQANGLLADEMKTLSELKLENCNYLYAMDLSGSSGFVWTLCSVTL